MHGEIRDDFSLLFPLFLQFSFNVVNVVVYVCIYDLTLNPSRSKPYQDRNDRCPPGNERKRLDRFIGRYHLRFFSFSFPFHSRSNRWNVLWNHAMRHANLKLEYLPGTSIIQPRRAFVNHSKDLSRSDFPSFRTIYL